MFLYAKRRPGHKVSWKSFRKIHRLVILTNGRKPLRRLVVTGNDSPKNVQVLFGPNWQASMQDLYVENRMEVLLNPPHGSPSYAVNVLLDNGGPSWSPRPASDEEQTRIGEIRAIQAATDNDNVLVTAGSRNPPR